MGIWSFLVLPFLLGMATACIIVFFRFRTRLKRHKQLIENWLSSANQTLASNPVQRARHARRF